MPERKLSPLAYLPSRLESLKEAQPFLMPRGGHNDTHVILPPAKSNRKIRFQEDVFITDIENRFYLTEYEEDDEEGSYEIEIVEDDGDADFYLEIVDGEVFYVFETEDDISVETDDGGTPNDEKQKMDDPLQDQFNSSMRLNIGDMMAPDLEDDDFSNEEDFPPQTSSAAQGIFSLEPEGMPNPSTSDAASAAARSDMVASFNQSTAMTGFDEFMMSSEDEGEEDEKAAEDPFSFEPEMDVPLGLEPESSKNESDPLLDLKDESNASLLDMLDEEGVQTEAVTESSPIRVMENTSIQKEELPSKDTMMEEPPIKEIIFEEAVTEHFDAPVAEITIPSPTASPKRPTKQSSVQINTESTTTRAEDRVPRPRWNKGKKETSTAPAPSKEVLYNPPSSVQAQSEPSSPSGRSDLTPLHRPIITSRIRTPSPTSPEKRSKSILKSNSPSPQKKMRKENRSKKTTKTFSKTYVRADQLDGEHRVYSWAKPDWTKANQLRTTGKGDEIRQGKNLAAPITFFPKKPVNQGVETDDVVMEELVKNAMKTGSANSIFGHHKKLKFSVNGSKLREGQDIVKPITQATVLRSPKNINHLANPGVLKPTLTGKELRDGHNLAAPVTFPTVKYDNTNRVANRDVLKNQGRAPGPKKQYEWSKPDWMEKTPLRNTEKGSMVKQGVDLQGPITQVGQAPRRKSFDDLSETIKLDRKSFDGSSRTGSDHDGYLSSDDDGVGGKSDVAVMPRRRQRRPPPRNGSLPRSHHSRQSEGEISNLSTGTSEECKPEPSSRSVDSFEEFKPEMDEEDLEELRKKEARRKRQELLAKVARSWQDD
jgi:hypothetical protein